MNYPNGKKPQTKIFIPSRGMLLEEMLNRTNKYYLLKNRAAIYKKPTPITIAKTNKAERTKIKITEAYFRIPSTTDYNGIYREKYIDFEAKETQSKNLPFQNFNRNQIEHLRIVTRLGAISFIIVLFKSENKAFLLDAETFILLFDKSLTGERKSISLDTFNTLGHEIPLGINPEIDYLSVIDNVFFKK